MSLDTFALGLLLLVCDRNLLYVVRVLDLNVLKDMFEAISLIQGADDVVGVSIVEVDNVHLGGWHAQLPVN